MTAYRVSFSEHAEADFESILHFIAADNPITAIKFIDRLERRAIDFLSVTPNAGTRIGHFRYAVFSGYVVAYTVDESDRTVTIALVTEGHRNWRAILEGRT